jgi:hypothetical protein
MASSKSARVSSSQSEEQPSSTSIVSKNQLQNSIGFSFSSSPINSQIPSQSHTQVGGPSNSQ